MLYVSYNTYYKLLHTIELEKFLAEAFFYCRRFRKTLYYTMICTTNESIFQLK